MAQLPMGPHPGARPGVGARMRVPGGWAFPHAIVLFFKKIALLLM